LNLFLRALLFLSLGAAAWLLPGCSAFDRPTQSRPAPTLILDTCSPELIPAGLQGRSRCGKLTVYEDRAAGEGRTIDLNVVVLPAVSRSPAPDPFIFLAGGPGQGAVDSFSSLYPVFRRINQKRDIVLVDQRGTGKSNPLDCPGTNDEFDPDQDLEAWLQSCLAGLDANPALYTTTIAMEDLDQLRAALGYEQVNLFGVSYGTRAALTYLRMYPGQVRSLILDGVVPQDQALGIHVARDAQQSLDLIFSRCEADPLCRETFPGLPQAFQELLDRLDQNPVEVVLPHPSSGQAEKLTFTREMMGGAVRLLSYAPETAALLPLLIHTAAEQDDFSLLAAQYLIVSRQLEGGMAEGMGYSVLCAEDLPFIDLQAAAQANANTYLGDQQTKMLERVCQSWPRGSAPDWIKEPVISDVPALLLSGEFDPVTPPENGEAVGRGLTNSLHLVAPGQGHNVIFRGCLPGLATTFIDQGGVQGLQTACLQKLTGAAFFLTFTGPAP
jgi:pimeloyl-ACP methyl ester carboxylesterase